MPTSGFRAADPAVEEFIAALPKVELHVHLEGSMQPATLLRLARKHDLGHLPSSLEAVRDWYAFRDFPYFAEVYLTALQVLCGEDDFADLVTETAASLAAQNVRYAEIIITPMSHLERGVGPETFFGGIEVERDQFRAVFARATAAGLRSVPHAGETHGPDRVWSAVHALGAERIGHGISCVRDPELVEYLRATPLPLDVCPTSNMCTGTVPDLAAHPLPEMLESRPGRAGAARRQRGTRLVPRRRQQGRAARRHR